MVYPLEQDLMNEHVRSLVAEGLVTPPRKTGKLDAKAFLALPKRLRDAASLEGFPVE